MLKFLATREHKHLHDSYLSKLSDAMLIFFLIYMHFLLVFRVRSVAMLPNRSVNTDWLTKDFNLTSQSSRRGETTPMILAITHFRSAILNFAEWLRLNTW